MKEAGLTTKMAGSVKGYNMYESYYLTSYMPSNWIDPDYKQGSSTNAGRQIYINGVQYYVHCAEPLLDAPDWKQGDKESYDCYIIGTTKANGSTTYPCNGLDLETQKLLVKALYYLYGGPLQETGAPKSMSLTGTDGKTYNLVNILKGYGMTDKIHFATMTHYLIGSIYCSNEKTNKTWTYAYGEKYLSDAAIKTYIPKLKATLEKLPDPGLISLSKTSVTATQSAGKFTSGSITYNCGLRENSISTTVQTGDTFKVGSRTYTAGQKAIIYGGESFVIESTVQNTTHKYHFAAKYNTDFAGYYINTDSDKQQDLVFGVDSNAGLDFTLTTGSLDGYIEIRKSADVNVNGVESQILKAWSEAHGMANAKYGVYSSSACTEADRKCTIELDNSGYGKSSALPVGTYWVKEIEAPDGYAINVQTHNVTVAAAGTATVNTTDKPLQGNATLKKIVEANANDQKVNSDITFHLTPQGGRTSYDAVTDANGIATWPMIPAGTYTLTEETQKYYQPLGEMTVVIEDGKTTEIGVQAQDGSGKVVENIPTEQYVRIVKTDSNTGGPVEGAVFTIQPTGGALMNLTLTAGTKIDDTHYATNEKGQISFYDVFIGGNYTLTETSAPADYTLMTPNPLTFDVDGTMTEVTVNCTDAPFTKPFKIRKIDKTTGEAVKTSGYRFEIFAAADIVDQKGDTRTWTDGTVMTAGTVIETIETDPNNDGFATTSPLYVGSYGYREVAINQEDGLVKSIEEGTFTISSDSDTVEERLFENDTNGLKLRKISTRLDENGEEIVLAGITFEITNVTKGTATGATTATASEGTLAPNYTITLMTDANGELKVDHLPVGDYEIRETATIPGYNLDTTVTNFTVSADGLIDGSSTLEVTRTNKPNVLYIHKYDIVEGEESDELPGATLTIASEDGTYTRTWVSGTEPYELVAIPAGTYTLTETIPPTLYENPDLYEELSSSITFTVTDSLEIQKQSFANHPYRKVLISKKALTKQKKEDSDEIEWIDGEELPGATLAIYDANKENIVKDENDVPMTWVSTDTPKEFYLPTGTYWLVETQPATGYTTAESIQFSVGRRETVGDNATTVTINGADGTYTVDKIEMKDKPTQLYISKKDIVNSEEVPGAQLSIYTEEAYAGGGEPMYNWTSTNEPHYIEQIPIGKYVLVEIVNPEEYEARNEDKDESGKGVTRFEVLDSGEVQSHTMLNVPYRDVEISKKEVVDGKGAGELEGAHLEVKNEAGEVVEAWVSGQDGKNEDGTVKTHTFKLPAGKYTLTETIAPKGFATQKNTVEFTVTQRGANDYEVVKAEMLNEPTKVKISKLDITDSKPVIGAVLVIKDKDGKQIDRWETKAEPHYIEKLPVGTYTLTEITAPKGYLVAETVTFKVEDTGDIQHVKMFDSPDIVTPPKTGDDLNTGLMYVLIALAMMLAIGGTILVSKKKKRG
ncbi:MAG: SpaA isopeptide-forming pilin-related protein [Lachnospiraceae bacterium]|nr:SpaA isopeptide-forming pilin-related protein [Lachnospiraceae bacterium]